MPGLGEAVPKHFRWDANTHGYTKHFIFESQYRYDGPTFHTLCDMTIPRQFAVDDVEKDLTVDCAKCKRRAAAHNED